MVLRIATADYFETLARFEQHLPAGKDPEILVLKGHLLVERLLDKYIEQNVANPSELHGAGLSFSQKISLVAAVHSGANVAWLWRSIRLLNKLRNELAHRLESKRYESVLRSFLAEVEGARKSRGIQGPRTPIERLHRAIFLVHDSMSHRVDL